MRLEAITVFLHGFQGNPILAKTFKTHRMIKKILFCLLFLLPTIISGAQESYNDRVQKYVDQYYALAIAEQVRAGVPAAVTLGQGILETEAGNSELMTQANNHFGIKCRNDWTGEYFLHDDDRPQERFKKYTCPAESYKDHSDHLIRNQRYASLFTIPPTDYASWARGLKRCGYATNPQYAQRLIKIIEDFNLQNYTLAALDSAKHVPAVNNEVKTGIVKQDSARKISTQPVASLAKTPLYERQALVDDTNKKTPVAKQEPVKPATASFDQMKNIADSARHHIVVTEEPAPQPILAAKLTPKTDSPKKAQPVAAPISDIKYDSSKIITVNGLKAFYAHKGEMLLQYAVKYNIRYPKLLEINELPDAPLACDLLIYTERKLTNGTHAKHTVKDGETMQLIAQEEGMQLKRLMALNKMEAGDEPATGSILELQAEAANRPQVRKLASAAPKEPTVKRPQSSGDYITVNHLTHDDSIKAKELAAANAARVAAYDAKIKAAEAAKTSPVVAAPATAPAITTPTPPPAPIVVAPQPTVAVQKAVVTDTIKHVADTAKILLEEPKETTPVIKPVLAMDTMAPVTAGHELHADTSNDDLAALKAELDKVVYADDSKLPATPTTKAADPKKTDAKKPAVKPEPKANAEDKAGSKYYTVKKGDTLSGIAKRNKVTLRQLQKWNNDIDPDDLSLGEKLRVKP